MTIPIQKTFRVLICLVLAAVLGGTETAHAQVTAYEKIAVTDPDVQAAAKAAIGNQQQKNNNTVKLLSIVSAERQPVSGKDLRLCLSVDRHGNTELARVVLSRNAKKQWSVRIWSWGSCGR